MDWDFWSNNKDAITTILAVLAALGAVAGTIWVVFKWGILRWWNNRIRVDVKVFEVISDSS
ncbi:MAG: hypothetical protein MUO77_06110, partial [Anaerolineales bacterium]|nr:hypothetical protein [Anaerolineales bacterium]